MQPAVVTLYSVGHSSRSESELVGVLLPVGIRVLVDVRATPASRRCPQFRDDAMRTWLEQAGISYHWAGRALGGRRRAREGSRHVAITDAGFRAYADHMERPEFQRAVGQLVRLAATGPTVILCAERDPAHCHRAMIADYLVLQGHRVVHLVDAELRREHHLDPRARRESAELVYDRMHSGLLDLPQVPD